MDDMTRKQREAYCKRYAAKLTNWTDVPPYVGEPLAGVKDGWQDEATKPLQVAWVRTPKGIVWDDRDGPYVSSVQRAYLIPAGVSVRYDVLAQYAGSYSKVGYRIERLAAFLSVELAKVEQPAPKPTTPAPIVEVKQPAPTLSEAAAALVAALKRLGKPANKPALLAESGIPRAAWSDALSEVYRARLVKRAKDAADVLHTLAA